MTEPFLRNTWYMAGWARDLQTAHLITQTIIDIPIVVVQSKDGTVYALHDRCPHRFTPLSRGQVTDQGIECGYHGLTFNHLGICVANPLGDVIPKGARVRRFPVHIQDEVVWVWPGDADQADTDSIPRFPGLTNPAWRFVFGTSRANANYQLLTDNLLDLTHAVFLHPVFGNRNDRPQFTMQKDGDTIWAKYQVNNVPCPEFFAGIWSSDGKHVDLWDDMRWNAPAIHYMESGVMVTGEPREQGIMTPAVHVLTPESATRTTYFWASGIAQHADTNDQEYKELLRQLFEVEDIPVIEAAQARMGQQNFWELKPVILKNDAAAINARRLLLEMIQEESIEEHEPVDSITA